MAQNFNDADSEYYSVDASPVTSLPMSFSMWVLADDNNPAADQYPFYYGNSGSNTNWLSLNFNTSGQLVLWARDADNIVTTTTDYADLAWHHVLGVYYNDGGSPGPQLFVDGIDEGTDHSGGTTAIADFNRIAIGMLRDSTPSAPFDGKVAELAIWSSQLGQTEANILSAKYSPIFVDPANRVDYWPLIRDINDRHGIASFDTTGGTPDVFAHPPIISLADTYTIFTPAAASGTIARHLIQAYRGLQAA